MNYLKDYVRRQKSKYNNNFKGYYFKELAYPIYFNEFHREESIKRVEYWWHKFKNIGLLKSMLIKFKLDLVKNDK